MSLLLMNPGAAYVAATESGDVSATIETAAAAVEAGRKVLEADDERLPLLLINHGKALISGAQPESAREVLEEALNLSEQIHGKDAVELIDVLEPLGDSVAGIGSASRQLRYYKRALKIIEQHFGRESIEYATASLRAGTKTYDLSQSTAGIKHCVMRGKCTVFCSVKSLPRRGLQIIFSPNSSFQRAVIRRL